VRAHLGVLGDREKFPCILARPVRHGKEVPLAPKHRARHGGYVAHVEHDRGTEKLLRQRAPKLADDHASSLVVRSLCQFNLQIKDKRLKVVVPVPVAQADRVDPWRLNGFGDIDRPLRRQPERCIQMRAGNPLFWQESRNDRGWRERAATVWAWEAPENQSLP